MKNEGEFNSKLSSWLKSFWSRGVFHLKLSDKYHVGGSDFVIWAEGRCACVESKFIVNLPKEGNNWLTHTFGGPQRTFMHNIDRAGSSSYGLVGVKGLSKMLLVPFAHIPPNGNLKSDQGGVWFPISKVGAGELMTYVFGGKYT